MDDLNEQRNSLKIKNKNRRRHIRNVKLILSTAFVVGLLSLSWFVRNAPEVVDEMIKPQRETMQDEDNPIPRPELEVDLLTPNAYSRPEKPIKKIRDIVIHYTANPGTSAKNNRDYFEGLKDSQLTKASSHFIVGIDGEIVQCIPTAEYSYASNDRNDDTISIETCFINEDGSYEEATYQSLVHLTAWLVVKFGLEPDRVIRHYDITGKICPKYFVENEDAWIQFKKDVKTYIDKYCEDY